MNSYAYEAVDPSGLNIKGTMDVANQSEALRRIKEMGLFPTRIAKRWRAQSSGGTNSLTRAKGLSFAIPMLGGRVKPAVVSVFTRQLATLVEAGLPLLRGLRILEQQESNRVLKRVVGDVGATIESGSSLTEALAAHPKVFNRLYVNMVKAGEASGALDIALQRLAGFMEKSEKIKGKVKSAMFYPATVVCVATAIMVLMMVFVVPRFQQVFSGLLPGHQMPAFTTFILQISEVMRHQAPLALAAVVIGVVIFVFGLQTKMGRWVFDQFKLRMPLLGTVFRKAAISRFARTLGTLLSNGVPILQALTIVKETAGNVVVGNVISSVHDSVKEGESITVTMRASRVFPPMIVGMVDVGEQTGALPDMLMKIADNYDEEVDNAVNGMTSLLEPIMIVFLAVIVGSIVIGMFLPLLSLINGDTIGSNGETS